MNKAMYRLILELIFLSGCRTGIERIKLNDDWQPYQEFISGSDMALVPPGCFMMGSNSSRPDQKPIHEVCFRDPYWIDIYEVTNEQYGSIGCDESSSRPNQPRNCITWIDASAHCSSRGARLPTEAEWEYAARGPDDLDYTWGNKWNSNNVVYGGNKMDGPADVGSRPGGVSWVGVYNLGGNLREWVRDWYVEEYYSEAPLVNPQGPISGEYRVVRTNSFGSHNRGFSVASYRTRGYPTLSASNRGFRCAANYDGRGIP